MFLSNGVLQLWETEVVPVGRPELLRELAGRRRPVLRGVREGLQHRR